jgi:hypothetical protein
MLHYFLRPVSANSSDATLMCFHPKTTRVGRIGSYSPSEVGEPVLGSEEPGALLERRGGVVWEASYGACGKIRQMELLDRGVEMGKAWDA